MNTTAAVIFIIVGALSAILRGLLNIGNNIGRGKRFTEMVGAVPARIIYGVVGIVLIVIGLVFLVGSGGNA